MSDCNNKLAGEFVQKCGHKPKQGVNRKWYGNVADIDRVATQLANRGTKVTALVLKAGAKIYAAGGNDNAHKIAHALSVGDFSTGYIHTDSYSITYRGANESERVQELVDGAKVFSIEEMVDTGEAGETTYKIAGLESGMKIINDDFDSSANSGVTQIVCATKEGEEEATGLKHFLLTAGLAATTAWIEDNVYVPAP